MYPSGAFFVFWAVILGSVLSSPCGTSVSFKCVSWNVNGISKFTALTPELGYLEKFDVVFLQETYTTSPENGLVLDGFIPFHVLARPTGRKPYWGLSTLVKINAFVGGTLRPIQSPLDWLQVTRWSCPSDRGALLINIYVAVHTAGFDVMDTRAAIDFLRCLRTDFPADSLLMGGDLNVDIWRLAEQRRQGVTIPHKARYNYMISFFDFCFLFSLSCLLSWGVTNNLDLKSTLLLNLVNQAC